MKLYRISHNRMLNSVEKSGDFIEDGHGGYEWYSSRVVANKRVAELRRGLSTEAREAAGIVVDEITLPSTKVKDVLEFLNAHAAHPNNG
jgi:hypothetical protein